ncbi:MAG: hypothetical protein K0R73_687 [Candidatus Midichloriaceae bacterium]|jgi:tetratricopeptide (TPR) repeat protein/predicted nucleotidyltransferase|nr:hypothetical protein [Candidatus Midichloriaceae bacterium]
MKKVEDIDRANFAMHSECSSHKIKVRLQEFIKQEIYSYGRYLEEIRDKSYECIDSEEEFRREHDIASDEDGWRVEVMKGYYGSEQSSDEVESSDEIEAYDFYPISDAESYEELSFEDWQRQKIEEEFGSNFAFDRLDSLLRALKGQGYTWLVHITEAALQAAEIVENNIPDLEVKEGLELHNENLKIAHRNKNYSEQIKCYIKMGEIYLEQHDYLKAIAFYNFAWGAYNKEVGALQVDGLPIKIQLLNKVRTKIIDKIEDGQTIFLKSIDIGSNPFPYSKVGQIHKSFLAEMRQEIKELLKLPDKDVQKTYGIIADTTIEFLQILIKESIFTLGKPPCNYAIIALGSLARKEATPYSDFEWAILIGSEEDKSYFQNLAILVHIKILNLGETTPRIMDMQILDWMKEEESTTSKGFAFDGQMQGGCKTPLGNAHIKGILEGDIFRLIQTPSVMADYHNQEWYEKDNHLSTVLGTVKLIYGNSELVDEYKNCVAIILNEEIEGKSPKSALYKQRAISLLQESSAKFEPKMGRHTAEMHYFDAKYDLYRLPNMIIDQLAGYYSLQANNLWDRIDGLQNHIKINAQDAQKLKDAVSKILLIRLEAYLSKGYRDDHVIRLNKENPQSNIIAKYLGINEEELFEIYYNLFALHNSVANFIESWLKDSEQASFFYHYNSGNTTKGHIYEKLLDYNSALDCLQEELSKLSEQEAADRSRLLMNSAIICHKLGDLDKALEYCEKAKAVIQELGNKGEIDRYIAIRCFMQMASMHVVILEEMGNYEEAEKLYAILLDDEVSSMVSKGLLIQSYNNYGAFQTLLGEYSKAREFFLKALEICKDFYGKEHTYYTETLANLAVVSGYLENHEESKKEHLKLLLTLSKKYGEFHPLVIGAYHNVGKSYADIGECQKALHYHQKALLVSITKYGYKNPSTAICLQYIGNVYLLQGAHKPALHYFKAAAEIQSYTPDIDKEHVFVNTIINMGNAYHGLGKTKKAIQLHLKALKILPKKLSTPKLADLNYNLGNEFSNLGDQLKLQLKILGEYDASSRYQTAIWYYMAAIKLFDKFFGDDNGKSQEAISYIERVIIDRLFICMPIFGAIGENVDDGSENIMQYINFYFGEVSSNFSVMKHFLLAHQATISYDHEAAKMHFKKSIESACKYYLGQRYKCLSASADAYLEEIIQGYQPTLESEEALKSALIGLDKFCKS